MEIKKAEIKALGEQDDLAAETPVIAEKPKEKTGMGCCGICAAICGSICVCICMMITCVVCVSVCACCLKSRANKKKKIAE